MVTNGSSRDERVSEAPDLAVKSPGRRPIAEPDPSMVRTPLGPVLADLFGLGENPFAPPPLASPAVLAQDEANVRARWDAEQAKLPPHKRRTWDQACEEAEQTMGRKLRAARAHGGP